MYHKAENINSFIKIDSEEFLNFGIFNFLADQNDMLLEDNSHLTYNFYMEMSKFFIY